MSSHSPPGTFTMRHVHPLATMLASRTPTGARVLDAGRGSGRNADGLIAAGFRVESTPDDAPVDALQGPFDAALSTHALLHGNPSDVAGALASIARALALGKRLYATLGNRGDARFGRGRRVDANTWAPIDGDEAGVSHAFFDEREVRALFVCNYALESLDARGVDAVAGSWAHERRPLRGALHWFVVARKRD